MIKRILTVVVLSALAIGMANAQARPGGLARQLAMGGTTVAPNFIANPFISDDPSYALLNPAYQAMYRDYAWLYIAGGPVNNLTTASNTYGNQSAGVIFGLNKEFTIGANFSYNPSPFVNGLRTPLNNFIGAVGERGANPSGLTAPAGVEVFEFVVTYSMGSLDLGLGVLYGWDNSDNKSTVAAGTSSAQLNDNIFAVRGGFILDLGSGNRFQGDAHFRMDKAKDLVTLPGSGNGTGESNYSNGGTELQADVRLRLKTSNKVNFLPYGGILIASSEPKQDNTFVGTTATTRSVKNSIFGFGVGAGAEYHTNQVLIAGGVSFTSVASKTETTPNSTTGTTTAKNTVRSFPIFQLGMEFNFTDWMIGRAGYHRAFVNNANTNEPPAPGANTESNYFAGSSNVVYGTYAKGDLVTLGLGLHFGTFTLEGTVSSEALRRGLGLIGSNDNINTFGFMTASYSFE